MIQLRNIRENPFTGTFVAFEAGSQYKFDRSLYDNLALYLKTHPKSLIADWYMQLSITDKARIIKEFAFV